MYPLTTQQRKAHAAAELDDTATFSADLRWLHQSCVDECKASPSTCPLHLRAFRALWHRLYLNGPGRWYSSNEKYKDTLYAMFDNDVNLIDIRKFVAQERRAHDKLDLTSPEDDEEPGITKAKAEAAAMFENPEISTITIVKFLQDKAAEIFGTKGNDELEYGKKLATCDTDAEKYLVRREYYTTPREGEDVSITEARNKWSQLFEQDRPWPEIRAVILKDAEDRDIENARTERIRLELTQELDNLKLGEAGHKKKQQRKKEREQASIAKFIKDNTQTCAGCEKPAVPLNTGLGPLECRGCEIMFRAGRQVHRTFFCSEECYNRFGPEHQKAEHPCAAGRNCVHAYSNHDMSGYNGSLCQVCFDLFDLPSYWCSRQCHEENQDYHDKTVHAEQRRSLAQKFEEDPAFEVSWNEKNPIMREEQQV